MKTIMRFLLLCTICTYSLIGWSQTTYTSNLAAGTSMSSISCPSGTVAGSGCSYNYLGNTIKMRVSSISGNKVTFEVAKCSGTFSSGSTLYIKEANGNSSTGQVVCGSQTPVSSSLSGLSSKSYTMTMSHSSGSMKYCGVIVGTTDRYYTNVITVTASTANQPPTTPSSPSPSDGATGVSTSPTLSWNTSDPEGGSVSYDLYMGTSTSNMTLKKSGQGTSAGLSGLPGGTKHYWKVIVYDNQSASTQSTTWSFTTQATNQPPTTPSSPSPSDGATGVSTSPTLSWKTSDPEGGSVSKD
jgi:hypothetical protein